MTPLPGQSELSAYARIKRAGRSAYEALPLVCAWAKDGRPDHVFRLDGGIGDEFLCSVLIHELKCRGGGHIWMLTDHPDLFHLNPDVTLAVKKNTRGVNRFLERNHLTTISLSYAPHINGRDIPPRRHIITALCERGGLSGRISKRPYLYLRPAERAWGVYGARQLAVQSSGLSAKYAALTKEWFPERLQQVVDRFRPDFTIVQVGAARDPLLAGVVDLRGKTSLRETAAVLANSVLFLGLAGFLQHLARSVECRSVIIYGGRELPAQTGYTCNENVVNQPECSPCWIYGRCDQNIKCMAAIGVEQVARAVELQAGRFGQPLAVDFEECSVDEEREMAAQ